MLLGLTKKNFELDFEHDYISLMWWLSAKSFVHIFSTSFCREGISDSSWLSGHIR
jgi:hypothetical protein